MNFYNTNYSKAQDTLKPQLVMHGNKLYGTMTNPTKGDRAMPWFEVRGGKVYTTSHNPQGHDVHPWFEIRGKNVYQTISHPDGQSHVPTFRIGSNLPGKK